MRASVIRFFSYTTDETERPGHLVSCFSRQSARTSWQVYSCPGANTASGHRASVSGGDGKHRQRQRGRRQRGRGQHRRRVCDGSHRRSRRHGRHWRLDQAATTLRSVRSRGGRRTIVSPRLTRERPYCSQIASEFKPRTKTAARSSPTPFRLSSHWHSFRARPIFVEQ